MADIITNSSPMILDNNISIKNILESKNHELSKEWDHEHVKYLAMELINLAKNDNENFSDEVINNLAIKMALFFINHNAEPDACDVLYELDLLHKLTEMTNMYNYEKICNYLLSCVSFETFPDDSKILSVVQDIYDMHKNYPLSLYNALRRNDLLKIKLIFNECQDKYFLLNYRVIKAQLSLILSNINPHIKLDESIEDSENLENIISNNLFKIYADYTLQELQLNVPKTVDQILKINQSSDALKGIIICYFLVSSKVDNRKSLLASTFVNGFSNVCSQKDSLLGIYPFNNGDKDLTESFSEFSQKAKSWIFKNQEQGVLAATASIGLICKGSADHSINLLSPFLLNQNDQIIEAQSIHYKWSKAGAALGIGLSSCGARDAADTTWALLREYLEEDNSISGDLASDYLIMSSMIG